MEYKLVALDLDDTLLRPDQTIDPQAKGLILELKKRGLEFIIATGRSYSAALPFYRDLNLNTSIICHNGAHVRSAEGKILLHRPISPDLAREVLQFASEHGLEACAYIKDDLMFRRRTDLTCSYEYSTGIRGNPTHYPLYKVIDEPPAKILILEDDKKRHEYYLQLIEERYRKRLNITTSRPEFIEIIASGVDKSRALSDLCRRKGFDREETVAVGNGLNDLEMIKWAGLGAAVANAPETVRTAADIVTASNEEEGVARFLQELFQTAAHDRSG